jgi:hypothetical protein
MAERVHADFAYAVLIAVVPSGDGPAGRDAATGWLACTRSHALAAVTLPSTGPQQHRDRAHPAVPGRLAPRKITKGVPYGHVACYASADP